MAETTKPLLDRLGVKAGMRIAVLDVDDPEFMKQLRGRVGDVVLGKPRKTCDIVFLGVDERPDLARLREAKSWIEPNGAVWVIRPKGGRGSVTEMDVLNAGPVAGLVDNKIASFSDTHSAMRFVFRLRDRPK